MDSFSLSHVEKKGSISMNHVFKRVQFCEYEKKGSILRVMFQKGSIIFEWYCWKKVSIPWSKLKKGSISRVTKNFFILESDNLQEGSILWVILWRGFNSLSPSEECSILWANFENPVQFFESQSKKRVQFCESCSKRMFNSVDQNRKCSIESPKNGFNSLRHEKEEGSILLSDKKGFNSLSHMKRFKRLELLEWVILVEKDQFLDFEKIHFLESYVSSKKRFNSLGHY